MHWNYSGTAQAARCIVVDARGLGLAFDGDTNRLLMHSLSDTNLYEMNPDMAATTIVGSTGLSTTVGLAYNPDDQFLFGLEQGADLLYRINPSTGQATAIGAIGFDELNVGMAFKVSAVPEPLLAVFLAFCSAMVVFWRRQKR